jgi:hypothetical protein
MTSLYLSTETTVIGLESKEIENHRSITTPAANPPEKRRTAEKGLRFDSRGGGR